MMAYEFSENFALEMDTLDPLASYRNRFHIPLVNAKESIYFTGNSLGLLPKSARTFVEQEFKDWETYGVEGHFHATRPWFHYHKFLTEKAALIAGALPSEVVVMNNLTTNLHLMMISFYRPQGKRTKILMEAGAFPSDQYAVESQVRLHGLDPATHIIEVTPRPGAYCIAEEDILSTIEQHGEEIALVMFGGVNYYTGQVFNMEAITHKAHEVGAKVGFDLAHAAGNLQLKLHEWGPDFAVWCSYKYLNSGPGGTSGAFVHERHHKDKDLIRLAGWWGHQEEVRFQMKKGFIPMESAAAWQLSNAQVFPMAIHLASLEIFAEVGMETLRAKSEQLTGFLRYVIRQADPAGSIRVITPAEPGTYGCQLSLIATQNGRQLFEALSKEGIIADWREPDVIRIAPVPLYNSFKDVYRFGQVLKEHLSA